MWDMIRPGLEVASYGNFYIERLPELSRTPAESQPGASRVENPSETDEYRKLMEATPPIDVPAEQVVVSGIQSRAFMRRKYVARSWPPYDYSSSKLMDDPSRPGSKQFANKTIHVPELTKRTLGVDGHAEEYALIHVGIGALLQSFCDATGFFWQHERQKLLQAVVARQVRPVYGESYPEEGLFFKPHIRPFRVATRYGGNGTPVSRKPPEFGKGSPKIVWQARYWMEDGS